MTTLLRIDAETLPRTWVLDPPMTDEEFEALCRENDNVQFERTKEGAIRMHPPAGGYTTSVAVRSTQAAGFACPMGLRSAQMLLICLKRG